MPLKKKRLQRKKASPKKKRAPKKALKRAKKTARRPAKKAAKKTARPKSKSKSKSKPSLVKPGEQLIGTITHYFPKVQAAVIKLKAPLSVGATIHIKGHTTDFTQTINSMQIDHVAVTEAKKGAEIGLLVSSRVREHDVVIKA